MRSCLVKLVKTESCIDLIKGRFPWLNYRNERRFEKKVIGNGLEIEKTLIMYNVCEKGSIRLALKWMIFIIKKKVHSTYKLKMGIMIKKN